MSIQTWKEEYYPVSAAEVAATGNAIDITEHSLRKWIGLLPDNLAKHGVRKGTVVRDLLYDGGPEPFTVTSDTCALCKQYSKVERTIWCEECPLYRSLGNKPCDENYNSPYLVWRSNGNPQPMIDALCATLEMLRNEASPTTQPS